MRRIGIGAAKCIAERVYSRSREVGRRRQHLARAADTSGMQATNDDCGVDPAAVWWHKQPAWPAELRAQFPAPDADLSSAMTPSLVTLLARSLNSRPLPRL